MKIKTLNELTLREFDRYKELISEENLDIAELVLLFGYNLKDMNSKTLQLVLNNILSDNLTITPLKSFFILDNLRFTLHMNLKNISASQFIDYQIYLNNNKIENILSVFLIPQLKKFPGYYKTFKYNEGYDINKIQEIIYNNITISEANAISNFFFQQSEILLEHIQIYLMKKKIKMIKKEILTLIKQNQK